MPVVPEPPNGSEIKSPLREPRRTQRRANSRGNVADIHLRVGTRFNNFANSRRFLLSRRRKIIKIFVILKTKNLPSRSSVYFSRLWDILFFFTQVIFESPKSIRLSATRKQRAKASRDNLCLFNPQTSGTLTVSFLNLFFSVADRRIRSGFSDSAVSRVTVANISKNCSVFRRTQRTSRKVFTRFSTVLQENFPHRFAPDDPSHAYAQTNADNNAEKVKAAVLKRGTSEKKVFVSKC